MMQLGNAEPLVSIVILNWNGGEDTIDCLESLQHIDYTNFEILLVDNGSHDRSMAEIKRWLANSKYFKMHGFSKQVFKGPFSSKTVKLLALKKNLGFAEGNNKAVSESETKAKYLLFLNNDTVVTDNFLKKLILTAEADEKIAVVGPKIMYHNNPKKVWFAGGRFWRSFAQPHHVRVNRSDAKKYSGTHDNKFITGCCMLVRRMEFKKIGGFDKEYFAYFEDIDLCDKFSENGYRLVYCGGSKIYHKESKSLGVRSPNFYYYNYRNRLLFARKRLSNVQFYLLFLPSFVAYRIALQGTMLLLKGKTAQLSKILEGIQWHLKK